MMPGNHMHPTSDLCAFVWHGLGFGGVGIRAAFELVGARRSTTETALLRPGAHAEFCGAFGKASKDGSPLIYVTEVKMLRIKPHPTYVTAVIEMAARQEVVSMHTPHHDNHRRHNHFESHASSRVSAIVEMALDK